MGSPLSSTAPGPDWPIEIVCVLTIFKCGGYDFVRYDTPDDFPGFNALLVRSEEVVALECRMKGAVICIPLMAYVR